jgi:hypothetical protein
VSGICGGVWEKVTVRSALVMLPSESLPNLARLGGTRASVPTQSLPMTTSSIHLKTDGRVLTAKIKSPEVMLNSFVSASSSL